VALDNRGITLVLATALISGFSIFINKFGVTGINSTVYTLARSLVVAGLLAIVILAFGKREVISRLTRRDWRDLAIVGLVGGSIPFLLFFRGLQLSASAPASFIHKTMFVFVAVLAIAFLKEKLSGRTALLALGLLAGNFLLLGGIPTMISEGYLLVLGATVFWAIENVFSKKLLERIEPNALALGRMGFGALFIAAYAAFSGELSLAGGLGGEQLAWVAVTSVVLLGYVLTWYNGLKTVSVTTATAVLLLGSPVTLALNLVFFGVAVTAFQAAGAVLLAVGCGAWVWLANRVEAKTPAPG